MTDPQLLEQVLAIMLECKRKRVRLYIESLEQDKPLAKDDMLPELEAEAQEIIEAVLKWRGSSQ